MLTMRLLGAILLPLSLSAIPALGEHYIWGIAGNEKLDPDISNCQSGVVNFENLPNLDCICVNGLYSFLHYHSNCSNDFGWTTRAGKGHCFQMKEMKKFNRVELLTSNLDSPSLIVLDRKYHLVKARYNSSKEFPEVRDGDIVAVIGTWTLVTTDENPLCVASSPEQYCLYRNIPKLSAFREGCHGQGKRELTPWQCHRTTHSDDLEMGCPDQKTHVIAKRAITGRSFLPATLAMKPVVKVPEAIEREEDFGLTAANGSDLIKSEVWNYLTQQTSNILNEKNLTSDRVYVTPAFDILQLSKRIMAKSCPSFYVQPSHWNMAVSSFIAMQQRSFKFREAMIDLVEYKRIRSTLDRCLANLTEIPFIPPNETCVDGETVITLEEGMYYANGEVQTMTIIVDQMSNSNEPFIETVWKIFVHVHSLCYEYFKTSPGRVNDHHRFTEMLMPLFTNDVWDIWMKDGEGKDYDLKKDVYAGLLGDAVKLMNRIDYCAWFPRFEANYPWDLIRPKAKQQSNSKRNETKQRKKRSPSNSLEGTCVKELGDFSCY